MASGRAADWEDPGKSRRNAARSLDWDPISELHQGQRSHAPHRRAGHMTAPDHSARTASKTLARGGRPHMISANLGLMEVALDAARANTPEVLGGHCP